jgi:GNAT superfamily N-acetyltransferase
MSQSGNMEIRLATMNDLDAVTAVEAECFPAAEAAGRDSMKARLAVYPDHFWLLTDGSRIVSFVNGLVTDEPDLTDEMYADASMHSENGKWQMIFGVDTIPEYRRQGCAGKLLERVIADAKAQKRLGLVLTCKDRLVHYYAKFGFADEGISDSTHGGVVWHKMRLTF